VRRDDDLTTYKGRLSSHLGVSTSCNPQVLSRPAKGLLYLTFAYGGDKYILLEENNAVQRGEGRGDFHSTPANCYDYIARMADE